MVPLGAESHCRSAIQLLRHVRAQALPQQLREVLQMKHNNANNTQAAICYKRAGTQKPSPDLVVVLELAALARLGAAGLGFVLRAGAFHQLLDFRLGEEAAEIQTRPV